MANINAPFGLRPARHISSHMGFSSNDFEIASGTAATLREGDPFKMTGTGKQITLAAAGDVAHGVFLGCEYVDQNNRNILGTQWITGSVTLDGSAARATGLDDQKNIVWHIQCDTLAAGDVGNLFDWNVGTGDSVYGRSGAYLDVGAGGATTGKSLRVLRLADLPGNAYGAYAIAEVMFAEGAELGITSGAGGV